VNEDGPVLTVRQRRALRIRKMLTQTGTLHETA